MSDTPTDEEGAEMIQYLQKRAGIDEPGEVALENWKKMSPTNRERTQAAYLYYKHQTN